MAVQGEPASDYQSLLNELALRLPSPASDYYAVTLAGDEQGRIFRFVYSHWIGFADKDHRIEMRAASTVRADLAVATWREVGERCLVVDNQKDIQIFFLAGGHAVVEKRLAESEIEAWLQPEQVVPDGLLGFTSVCSFPANAYNRAPTPKLRMQVIKRDGYRCRICGRRPDNNSDIELHVHHIRPWADGGITIERNLITLCHTCHNGLSPHYEPTLQYIVDPQNARRSVTDHVAEYNEGVRQYGIILYGTPA